MNQTLCKLRSLASCFILLIAPLLLITQVATAKEPKILLGIDVLQRQDFKHIKGLNVGLLTNPAGVNNQGISTIDILHQSNEVNLIKLFGPEHGIYGDEKANQPIDDRIDPKTRLPVFSLYGKYRSPTPEMLRGLDAMVIDLQDIGARSYTYVSCMRLVMQACFTHGVQVVILDRPNPLGGLKVDGPMMEEQFRSYVGAFPVPYVHGLTIGELAYAAKESEGWLELSEEVRRRGKLTIIPMFGWKRDMTWNDTGLDWVPTSPAIPTLAAVLGYAIVGLGAEINAFSHGIGTEYPFRFLRFPEISPSELRARLSQIPVEGVRLMVMDSKRSNGVSVKGVYVQVSDWNKLNPTAFSFHMSRLACELSGDNPYAEVTDGRALLYNKHVGSQLWWQEISTRGKDTRVELFLKLWDKQAADFKKWSRQYWIYEE